jgi:cytochrome c oxidase subunit II
VNESPAATIRGHLRRSSPNTALSRPGGELPAERQRLRRCASSCSGFDVTRSHSREAFVNRHVIIFVLAIGAMSTAGLVRHVGAGEEVRTIDVTASRFQFDPETISVAQGDSVRLRLRSADRSHAFAIKAFRVKALIPEGGETVTVEFVAEPAGTFAFTCAEYCGTGHSEMKGRLVVLAKAK